MSKFKKYWFSCSCSHIGHSLLFTLDNDDDLPEMWLETHLEDTVWYKRMWIAIRYACGYKCRYGAFGCWIMDVKDASRMKKMVEEFETLHNNRLAKIKEKKKKT